MGKKKGNKTSLPTNQPPINQTPMETLSEIMIIPDDPVSQIKNSLAILTKHVEAMGAILGVPKTLPPQRSTVQNTITSSNNDISDGNPHTRPSMTQEEKKVQRAAKAAEKKARAEAAIAKKVAMESSKETNGMPLEEAPLVNDSTKNGYVPLGKAKKRAAMLVEMKAQAEAEIARKSSIDDGNVPTTSTANNQENGYSDGEANDEKRTKAPDPSTIPNYNKVPKKSSLKKGNTPSETCDDRRVDFDFQTDVAADSEDEMPYVHRNWSIPSEDDDQFIHPAFKRLYSQCDKEMITEIDDLCIEFITTFREYYTDFLKNRAADENASKSNLGFDLKKALNIQILYLTHNGRWPLPPPLGTIVGQLKREMNKIIDDKDAEIMSNFLEIISRDYFEVAYKQMSNHLREKIKKVKRIVLFNVDRVMEKVIMNCKEEKLTVCVIDNEPNGRGYQLAKLLMNNGFQVEYTDLEHASTSIRPHCLAIFGSTAILSNGTISSAMGTSQLCLLCQLFNVPTMFLAQTFKFLDKVSIKKRMALLHRKADEIVLNDLVTALITDLRIVPSTSAPAILKAKSLYNLET